MLLLSGRAAVTSVCLCNTLLFLIVFVFVFVFFADGEVHGCRPDGDMPARGEDRYPGEYHEGSCWLIMHCTALHCLVLCGDVVVVVYRCR